MKMTVVICVLAALLAVAASEQITVRRCCPREQKLNQNLECVSWPEPWVQNVVSEDLQRLVDLDEAIKQWKVIVERPSCAHPEVVAFPNVILIENGALWLRDKHVEDGRLFCVDNNEAIICPQEAAPSQQRRRVYINKCCAHTTIYSQDEVKCVEDGSGRDSTLAGLLGPVGSASVDENMTSFDVGFPRCDDGAITAGKLGERGAQLLGDGSLELPASKQTVLLNPRTFCIEFTTEDSIHDQNPTIFTCPNYLPLPENGTEYEYDVRFSVYPLGLLLSVMCLALTLAVGYLMPSAHHLLHWRCQTCHVACLLVGDLLLAIVQLSGQALPGCLCAITASAMHFFFLAAFFWLNTMCFNIWWTFRDIRPSTLDKRQESVRLRVYNAYAWGMPSLIAATAVLMDRVGDESLPAVLRPQFGVHKCWFYGDNEILTYFYGPVGVLLIMNIVLFGMTTWELTCGLWKREMVKTTSERAALGRVCWKLVVVMGVTWIADVISWMAGGPQHLWLPTDIINTLQGVFIFIVVACQPQVFAAIKRLWCPSTMTMTSGHGHHQHSTSQDVPSLNDSVVNTNSTNFKTPPDETIC